MLNCSAYKTSYLAPSWVKIPVLRTKWNAYLCFGEYFKILLDLFCIYLCINYTKISSLLLCRSQSDASLQRIYILISALCIYISWAEMWTYCPFLWSLFIQSLIYIKTVLWNTKSGGQMFKITTNRMKRGENILCKVPPIFVTKCSYFRSWVTCWLLPVRYAGARRNYSVSVPCWAGGERTQFVLHACYFFM